ncbi:MAG: class II glutamine amidotransferase [Bdellovibrionales bacterium]|nr:class II glutamine amidotransferase [Oligoflexia bacterium]
MCQLLGMSCNVPTDICFSFSGFQARGGLTDEHQDGWGIAFFEGKGVRQFLDSKASAHSPIAELVRNYPIKSKIVISHIRKATQGEIRLENTHPFMRELWGFYWIFAHNGNLLDFKPVLTGEFLPVGDTDSEHAFCYLLQRLRKTFGNHYPGTDLLFSAVRALAVEIGNFGEFNFLFSNGEVLLAHCSTHLSYVERKAPFSRATLKDQELEVDFSDLTSEEDQVAVIATAPLTHDEEWTIMSAGTLHLFEEGLQVKEVETIAGPEEGSTSGLS